MAWCNRASYGSLTVTNKLFLYSLYIEAYRVHLMRISSPNLAKNQINLAIKCLKFYELISP